MIVSRRPFTGIASLLSVLVLLSPAAASAQPGPKPVPKPVAPDPLVRMNESIDALTRKVWPSVVQILVSSYAARPEGASGEASIVVGRQQSTGSGFVIDPGGYILTNAHVVNGARRVQVVVPVGDSDGTIATALAGRASIVPARIIGLSTELDLALLKVDDMKLPALPLATYSDLRQGETVFAFGSPIGLRNSLTHGLVSAVARQVDPDSPLIYIQTDAPINPGNSGGPLVNIRGEVVGINTFIVSQSGGNEGLGFAIPSATARTAVSQLRQFGTLRRQEVGMSLQKITPTMAASLVLPRDYGVIVSDVWPGGPAEAAGLKVGDVLLSVDGQPADNLPTVVYNFRLRDSTDPVRLEVMSGAKRQTLSVATVEVRADFDSVSALADPEKNMVPELGILALEIDPGIAATSSGLRDPNGVIVIARTAGGASDVPLQAKDVIRRVNNLTIATLQQLRDAVRPLSAGTPVTLQVQREGRLTYLSFTFER